MRTEVSYDYNEKQKERRDNVIEILKALEADYRKYAEPYIKILAEIDASARQTIYFVPEDTDEPRLRQRLGG